MVLPLPGTHMKVKIVNKSSHPSPHYATSGSSGLDIRADIIEPIHLAPMERRLIPTGIFIALPIGYEAQVRPRSGLALKQGITCLNSPGTVDADYRGELKVLLINLSAETQIINNGDRIAQMVIQQVSQIEWEEVDILEETNRGAGGFGSTGNH